MKTIVKIGLIAVVAWFFIKFFLGGRADRGVDVSALIQGGALVVDVRTPGEFSREHISGAINISYNAITQKIARHTLDKGQPVILYCHSGARASAAKKSLIRAGYTNVVNAATLHNMRKILGQ